VNGFVAEDDALAVRRNSGHAARRGSGRDNDFLLRRQRARGSVAKRNLDAGFSGEARRPFHPLDFVLLEEQLDAAGQTADDLVLPRVNGRHVDADRGAVYARQSPFLCGLRQLQSVGVLEQGFRGDAPPDEAGAAEGLLSFDHRHGESQLRRPNRGDIPAGAGANDDDVELVRQRLIL
jgi:hypothetical protein